MFAIASFNLFSSLLLPKVYSVSVHIDGVIDLGPKWNYEYKLAAIKSIPREVLVSSPRHKINKGKGHRKRHHKERNTFLDHIQTNGALEWHVTQQYVEKFQPKNLFYRPRAVKEDKNIQDFIIHVFKQSMNVFEQLKKKISPEIKDRVNTLAGIFEGNFKEFVNETMNHQIKTKLGPQRVISNAVDTSNRLLKRLVNYFIGDLKKKGFLKENDVAINAFQKEVERQSHLELFHVCNKFGICSSSYGFSDFLTNFFTIILKNDNSKIKRAADAFSEVVKNTDFSKVMSHETKNLFKRKIDRFERLDQDTTKAFFLIVRNVIALKNKPLKVMERGNKHVNKTVAFLEVIDILDKTLPANEENKLEWSDLVNSLTDWSDGKRNDILEVMQGFVHYIKTKAVDLFESSIAKNVNEKLFILFS